MNKKVISSLSWLTFVSLLISCSKSSDFPTQSNLMGYGYAVDYFKGTPVPNLMISVVENATSSNESNATYASIQRGTITVDSNGYFNFSIPVFSVTSTFDFNIINNGNYRTCGTTSFYFFASKSANFNFLICPSGMTDLKVLNTDTSKFDSIRIFNPYYRKNVISWDKTIYLPGLPPPHLYIYPLQIPVLSNSMDTITWTYFKNGQPYAGKEIDYKQADYGQTTTLTLPF